MFPSLAKASEFCSKEDMEIIERQIIQLSETGMNFYKLSKKLSNWKKYYTFVDTEDGKHWVHEIRGIHFTTPEAAEMYAFLDFCNLRLTMI